MRNKNTESQRPSYSWPWLTGLETEEPKSAIKEDI